MRKGLIVGVSAILAVVCSQSAQAGEAEVKSLLAKKVAILTNLHQKAEKSIVNSAQDKIFSDYFSGASEADKKALKQKIDALSLNVQANFQVEEMCLITDKGQEVSRIVGKKVAPDADLSADEASSPFFKGAFTKEAKQVYISPTYLSADADKFVVAYTTPIMGGGKKAAILHYEHGLNVFQENLDKDVSGADLFVLAVDKDGYVLSDSRKRPAIAKQGEKKEVKDYFAKIPAALAGAVKLGQEGNGSYTDGGAKYLAAFKPLNDWTIVVVEKQK